MKEFLSMPSPLIFVRHGHVEGISPERFRGRTDLALTALGRKQALETAQYVASEWSLDAIYSSPLKRCMDTARAIADKQNLKVKPSEDLIDMDYGKWQGETKDHIESTEPDLYRLWLKHPQLTVIEDAETLADVQARIVRAFHTMTQCHPTGTVLAVAHDSTIRLFLSLMLDLPLSAYWRMKQEPCAINVLTFESDKYQLCCLNSTGHIKETVNSSHSN